MKNILRLLLPLVLLMTTYSILCAQIYPYVVQPVSCDQDSDGEVSVLFGELGGEPLEPYCSFQWTYLGEPSQTYLGKTVSGLPTGTYLLTVTVDACDDKVIFEDYLTLRKNAICRNFQVEIIAEALPKENPCDGAFPSVKLEVVVRNGVPPYRYSWTGGRNASSGGTMHADESDIYSVTVTDANGHSITKSIRIDARIIHCAVDPNEIFGPSGFDSVQYVNASDRMDYKITFENDSNMATAPASRVTVSYPIPANQDIHSVQLGDFGFAGMDFSIAGQVNTYSNRLNLVDSLGVWVDVTAGIDVTAREVYWIFQSVDPATGYAPSSSLMGFLPINDTLGRGEGYVNFFISPSSSVATGDTVGGQASIVFDANAPIETNVWTNTFDAVAPTSSLTAVMADDSSECRFTFAATDDPLGAGVASVELLVSENGNVYSSAGYYNLTDTAHYPLTNGVIYRFASRAVDNVSNREPIKSVADASFDLNVDPSELLLTNASFDENAPISTFIGTLFTLDHNGGDDYTYTLVEGGGGADNGLFYIQGNKLYTQGSFSCIGRYDFHIRVRTTDIGGLYYEKEFTLRSNRQNLDYSRSYTQAICQGKTYTFGQRLLTEAGTYTDSLQTIYGCDSIVKVNLVVRPTYHGTQPATTCENRTFTWEGHNMTFDSLVAGLHNYDDSLYTTAGCDSTITLSLTVLAGSTQEVDYVGCDSIIWENYTFTHDADTAISFENSNGCDSIIRLHLSVGSTAYTTIADTAQTSYQWHGQTYTQSGEYYFTTQSMSGCDSVVTLLLTITQGKPFGTVADLEGIMIYPNPTAGLLNIAASDVELVEVFDQSGRLVATYKSTNRIDLSDLSSGTYALRITLSQGRTVRRVVKH